MLNKQDQFLLEVLEERFPDGVDVRVVPFGPEGVFEWVAPDSPEWTMQPAAAETSLTGRRCYTPLAELEPETGIFAGMSDFSHTVFVYFAPESYL